MKSLKLLALGLFLAALAAGCGPQATGPATPGDKRVEKNGDPNQGESKRPSDGDDHPHGAGPNGGVIFDLGKYHAEFTVSHEKKECYVLFIKGDDKTATPLPVACKELTVSIKETKTKDGTVVKPMTITLKPADEKDGKAAKFVGTDPGIGNVADFEGDVTGEIGGKGSSGKFKE
jgi:hypothetical protein